MAEILAENTALRARVAALEAAAASLTADIKIEAVGADVSEAHAAVSAIFAHSRAETTFRLQPFNDQVSEAHACVLCSPSLRALLLWYSGGVADLVLQVYGNVCRVCC